MPRIYSATFECRACGNNIELHAINPITDPVCPSCDMAERAGRQDWLDRNKQVAREGKANRSRLQSEGKL